MVTDLLVFRRHPTTSPTTVSPTSTAGPGVGAGVGGGVGRDLSWLDTVEVDVDGRRVAVNAYLVAHPDQVLGELAVVHGQFADDLTVHPTLPPGDLPAALTAAAVTAARSVAPHQDPASPTPTTPMGPTARIGAVVGRVGGVDVRGLDERVAALLVPGAVRHEGHIAWDDSGAGRFTQVQDGQVAALAVPRTQAEELRRLVELRDLTHALLTAEAATSEDTPQMGRLRAGLNARYDAYVARFGPVNRIVWGQRTHPGTGAPMPVRLTPGQGGFRHDPASAVVYALERFDPVTAAATKASIFTTRVVAPRRPVERVDTPGEALAVVMDTHGRWCWWRCRWWSSG